MPRSRAQPSALWPRALRTVATATVLLCACATAWAPATGRAASAGQSSQAHTLSLTATFTPERLGAGTTIRVGFGIATPPGRAPSPVTDVELLLPPGLAIASSDLGLETCEPAKLESEGFAGCPPDSLMGRGSAAAEVPFGSGFVTERAPIRLFWGPLQEGHPQLLFFAEGEAPVLANIIFGALVLPAPAPVRGRAERSPPARTERSRRPGRRLGPLGDNDRGKRHRLYRTLQRQDDPLPPARHRPARQLPPRRIFLCRPSELPRRHAGERHDDRKVPASRLRMLT